jgi:hypothetical protein
MDHFKSTQELLDAFGDVSSKSFYGAIPLTDTPVGFSIKKDYPEGIRYKPPLRQDNRKPDVVAVLWVVYLAPKPGNNNAELRKIPVRIRVSALSHYLANHFDYNFSDINGGSPSKESIDYSLSTPMPVELSYENAYFYNHHLGYLVDKNGNRVSGADLLESVFQAHCNTVHFIKGLGLRLKLAWQAKSVGLASVIAQFITGILKFVFGRTLESKVSLAGLYKPYPREALKKLDQDSIEIFGYKAAKPVIITFCLIIIVIGVYCYNRQSSENYLTWLIGQDFLLLAHGIFLIWALDVAIPLLLFWAVNRLIRLKSKIIFSRFNV